jgi:hypothetical protein
MASKNDDSSIANAKSGINAPKKFGGKFCANPAGKATHLAVLRACRE